MSSSANPTVTDPENSDGRTTISTAIQDGNNKRGRRVSFAENTTLYLFDRDDESSETASDGSAKTNSQLDDNGSKHNEEQVDEDNNSNRIDDTDKYEEGNVGPFFRPIDSPSPASNLGSASSSDEDDLYGPVSTSFIKPGRLSGSATSDNNHDITMDSTAFSMHFRSLARSESGEDFKTPTGTNLSFGEKTPNQTTLGSSMDLTEAKKPNFKSGLHAASISGCSDSSDMSLVVENSRKYEYDRLLPGVDDQLSEVEKNLFVNLLPGDRDSSDMSLEVEKSHSYESCRLLPGTSLEVDKNVPANLVSRNTDGSRSPGAVRSNVLHLEQGNGLMELNDHIQIMAHNDILIDRGLENQMDDANGGIRASAVHPPTGRVRPCSLDIHPFCSIPVDNAIVSSNKGKIVVNGKKTDDHSALSHPAEHDIDTEFIESCDYNKHEGEPLLLELGSSPSKQNKSIMDTLTPSRYPSLITPPQNQNVELPLRNNPSILKSVLKLDKLKTSSISIMDTLTPSSYPLLVTSPQNQNVELSLGNNPSIQKSVLKLDKLNTSSISIMDTLTPSRYPLPVTPAQNQNVELPLGNNSSIQKSILKLGKLETSSMLKMGTLTTRVNPSESRSNLSKDVLQTIPGSASLSNCRNLTEFSLQKNLLESFDQSPPKQYVLDVNVPGGNHSSEMDNFASLFNLTDDFGDSSARKRRIEMKSGDNRDVEISTVRSPKLQKLGSDDVEILGCPSEVYQGTHTSDHELKRWIDASVSVTIYAKFSEDAEKLLPSAADNLDLHAIDMMDDVLVNLQRSKSYIVLRDGILLQKASAFSDINSKRIVNARSLLQKILYERAKSQLMRLKRAKVQDKLQQLKSGLLGSQMLKSSLSPPRFPIVVPVDAVCHQSLSLGNKDGKEDTCDRVTALRQHLEDSNNKIPKLLEKLQLCSEIRGHSWEDTLVLVKEHLMKRTRSRSIRLDIQMWGVHAAESRDDRHTFILSYHDIVIQRVTVSVGPDSSIAIINKADDIEILKKFPNMDALAAFNFVLNNEYSRKYVGLRSLAQETQVTSSIMRSLLDVIEEVQLAQIEIRSLTGTSFYSQSAEQLGLRLCFFNFKTVRKLTLTLDISCLKRGIYPSDVLPAEFSAATDAKVNSCIEQIQILEIKNAVQNVGSGYMRILRLCRCISQAIKKQVQ